MYSNDDELAVYYQKGAADRHRDYMYHMAMFLFTGEEYYKKFAIVHQTESARISRMARHYGDVELMYNK